MSAGAFVLFAAFVSGPSVSAASSGQAPGTDLAATTPASASSASSASVELVRTIETSTFDPPSPDANAITYLPGRRTLLLGDSEVNETPLYRDANLWELTTDGTVRATGDVTDITDEPTGLTVNPANNHVFVASDDDERVYEIAPGPDGTYGRTGAAVVGSFDTTAFGSDDPEGVTFDSRRNRLAVVDGSARTVFVVSPGPNGAFDGVDDSVTSFGLEVFGVGDPEGIAYNDETDTFVIVDHSRRDAVVETTTTGELVRIVDLTVVGPGSRFSGITIAPSSVDPSRDSWYIADRGVDNNVDPDENDGRIHEVLVADGMIGRSDRRCFTVAGSPGDAAVVNLTPVLAVDPGHGSLMSSDVSRPPVVSNVNFAPGTVDPNVAVAPIGADGRVCYVNSEHSAVHLVADHLGTIAQDSYRAATPSGAPNRTVDTRTDGSVIAPNGRRCFAVTGSPGDAAVVNLTPVLAATAGHGSLVSSDVSQPPVVSNVNFAPGTVDPNVAVAPIGADGRVCFVNSEHGSVHLVADHLGTIAGGSYRAATRSGAPNRTVDTRTEGSAIGPNGRRCFAVTGAPGGAAMVNLTPVLAPGPGHGSLVSSDVEQPPVVSNVNFRLGSIDPNVALAPIGADNQVCFFNSVHVPVHLVADHLGTIAEDAYDVATPSGAPNRVIDTRVWPPREASTGMSFGPFFPPDDAWGSRFSAGLLDVEPDNILRELEMVRAAGASVVVNLAGKKESHQNPDETINVEMWKAVIDEFAEYDLSSYVADGTLAAHYLTDEPKSRGSWGEQIVHNDDIDEMARHSKSIWPDLPTTVRVSPTKLARHAGGYDVPLPDWEWRHLDIAWAQYSARFGSVVDYTAAEIAEAERQNLGLVFGLNVIDGGDGSSGVPGDRSGAWSMSAQELRDYAGTLIRSDAPCAFLMWRYDWNDYVYFERPEIDAAVRELAVLAAGRDAPRCTVRRR